MTSKPVKQPTVTVRIVPGKGKPGMKSQWIKFWQRLIEEVCGHGA